jgi:large subunit ribosomal protein L9
MKVILLQNIKGVGRMGDVKNVADGYGRNYLLINNLAKLATKGTINEVDSLRKRAESEMKIAEEKAKEIASKSKDITLEFNKKASKTGKLFASVTKEEIAETLSKAIGAKIDVDSINLNPSASSGQEIHGEHIKQEGEHMIEAELIPGVKVEFKVTIKGE